MIRTEHVRKIKKMCQFVNIMTWVGKLGQCDSPRHVLVFDCYITLKPSDYGLILCSKALIALSIVYKMFNQKLIIKHHFSHLEPSENDYRGVAGLKFS